MRRASVSRGESGVLAADGGVSESVTLDPRGGFVVFVTSGAHRYDLERGPVVTTAPIGALDVCQENESFRSAK